MRVKIFALACVAALATVMPARADVILGFRIGSPPSGLDQTDPTWIDNEADPVGGTNQPVPLGAPIPGGVFTLVEGTTGFLQVTIQTNANALSAPTPSFPQSAWNTSPPPANRLITIAFGLNYPLGIMNNPFAPPVPPLDPDQNNRNARTIVPFATGNPNTFPGYNMGSTAISGSTTGNGIGATAGQLPGERVIAVFRLVGVSPGSGNISLFDLNPVLSAAGFGLQLGQNLDEYVFHPSKSYVLPVTVTPVPEPSSMALAGLAFAGIGWRKLRRKTTKAAVAV